MIVLVLATALAAQGAPKAELRTPAKGVVVVGSAATQGGKGPSFEISVGNCLVAKGAPKGTTPDCGVFVALTGKKAKGKEKLQWTAKPGAIFRQSDTSVAVGDEADTALAVSWRPLTLAKDIEGIVVTQQSGGDRVKHRHDVFLNVKGKLNYAFTASEPRGPMTWSSVTSLDLDGNGGEELLLMHAQRPDEEEADLWQLEVYGWRPDAAKIVKLPSWTPTVRAAIVGSFTSIAEARELQSDKCLREFIVMDKKSAPTLQDATFIVAFPAATARDADLALEAATACNEDLVGAVKIISRGMDVDEK
jgi:hypothetical protein